MRSTLTYQILLVLPFTLLISGGCKQSSLTPSEIVRWVENKKNGLVVEKSVENLTFKLQYQPLSYLIANEMRTNQIDAAYFAQEKAKRDDLQYFTLKILDKRQDGFLLDSADNHDDRINYFMFDMQSDLKLVESGDSLDCQLFHFENTIGITPELRFLLGFERRKGVSEHSDKTLLFKGSKLGLQELTLQVLSKDLAALPEMELE